MENELNITDNFSSKVPYKLALILTELDNLILDNYDRKFATYLELGWDPKSIKNYLKDKKNIMKIASFNTPTISFTASSRRNRYYQIYNRDDMLLKDKPLKNSVEALNEFANYFKIFIITSRKENLKQKTIEVLKKHRLDIEKMEIFFLKQNQSLDYFRRTIFESITENYSAGFIITLNPRDVLYFQKYNYKIIGFTAIYDMKDFTRLEKEIQIDMEFCRNWKQIISYIRLAKEELYQQEFGGAEKEFSLAMEQDLSSSIQSEIDDYMMEEIQPESMLEEAVYQQLFMGANRIMGSKNGKGLVVVGVGRLLKNFINELKSKFKLIYLKKINDFLSFCEDRFKIDLNNEKRNLNQQISMIDDWDSQKMVMIYVVLTKVLENFRKNAFNEIGLKKLREIYREFINNPLAEFPANFHRRLKDLSDKNDDDVLLLYNLSFLTWLSSFYNDIDVYINIERVMTNIAYRIFLTKLISV
ncbi:MAG: hypothetical protein ACTSRZ_14035 [Promethearchaeota archaeon]